MEQSMTKEFIDSMLAGDDAVNAYGRLVSLAIGLAIKFSDF